MIAAQVAVQVTFSVRLPKELVDIIDSRAAIRVTSRNNEVGQLIAYAIDHAGHMDTLTLNDLLAVSSRIA